MRDFANKESGKMQGQEALRTVECLRGRLQAERAASRAAEQNAELLAKQVTLFSLLLSLFFSNM